MARGKSRRAAFGSSAEEAGPRASVTGAHQVLGRLPGSGCFPAWRPTGLLGAARLGMHRDAARGERQWRGGVARGAWRRVRPSAA